MLHPEDAEAVLPVSSPVRLRGAARAAGGVARLPGFAAAADDWRLQLQQMMGYLLWPGYDLQKFFHFFGPPRAGKGIIIQVAADMGGGACTITLDGFCDSFGLEKAIGQRLILVGETEKGPTKYPAVRRRRRDQGHHGRRRSGSQPQAHQERLAAIARQDRHAGEQPLHAGGQLGGLDGAVHPVSADEELRRREDLTLREKLRREYPGIFAWCLEGLRSLHGAGRFTLCESTQSELEQSRDLATPLQTFIEDCCNVDTATAAHCTSLYRIFEQWLVDQDAPLTWNDKQFGNELRTAIPAIERKRLSNRTDAHYNGAVIVKTDFDSDSRGRGSTWASPPSPSTAKWPQLLTRVVAFSTCATPRPEQNRPRVFHSIPLRTTPMSDHKTRYLLAAENQPRYDEFTQTDEPECLEAELALARTLCEQAANAGHHHLAAVLLQTITRLSAAVTEQKFRMGEFGEGRPSAVRRGTRGSRDEHGSRPFRRLGGRLGANGQSAYDQDRSNQQQRTRRTKTFGGTTPVNETIVILDEQGFHLRRPRCLAPRPLAQESRQAALGRRHRPPRHRTLVGLVPVVAETRARRVPTQWPPPLDR